MLYTFDFNYNTAQASITATLTASELDCNMGNHLLLKLRISTTKNGKQQNTLKIVLK